MAEQNNESPESALEPRRSSRRKVPVKTYHPAGDNTVSVDLKLADYIFAFLGCGRASYCEGNKKVSF